MIFHDFLFHFKLICTAAFFNILLEQQHTPTPLALSLSLTNISFSLCAELPSVSLVSPKHFVWLYRNFEKFNFNWQNLAYLTARGYKFGFQESGVSISSYFCFVFPSFSFFHFQSMKYRLDKHSQNSLPFRISTLLWGRRMTDFMRLLRNYHHSSPKNLTPPCWSSPRYFLPFCKDTFWVVRTSLV